MIVADGTGIGRWRQGKYEVLGHDAGYPGSGPFCVLDLGEGRYWFGDRDSVIELTSSGFRTLRSGLQGVRSLTRGRDGTIWVASGSGLHAYRDGSWLTITDADGLPAGSAYDVLETRSGDIWASTTSRHQPLCARCRSRSARDVPERRRERATGAANRRSPDDLRRPRSLELHPAGSAPLCVAHRRSGLVAAADRERRLAGGPRCRLAHVRGAGCRSQLERRSDTGPLRVRRAPALVSCAPASSSSGRWGCWRSARPSGSWRRATCGSSGWSRSVRRHWPIRTCSCAASSTTASAWRRNGPASRRSSINRRSSKPSAGSPAASPTTSTTC